MTQDPTTDGRGANSGSDGRTTRFLGSLKDALAAASRDETVGSPAKNPPKIPTPAPASAKGEGSARSDTSAGSSAPAKPHAKPDATVVSAASAAQAVRGTSKPLEEQQIQLQKLPTTRVVKASDINPKSSAGVTQEDAPARTQLVRGRQKVERGDFEKDPVVGWLVVVGGPGIGNYRPIFEGNNAVGRASHNRVPIDFGDEAISSEEQAYVRYDSSDRSFLFVPNLAKTNVVSVNNEKPTGAVALNQMDVIMMGRTQLVFVPFCGAEFDWSALGEGSNK